MYNGLNLMTFAYHPFHSVTYRMNFLCNCFGSAVRLFAVIRAMYIHNFKTSSDPGGLFCLGKTGFSKRFDKSFSDQDAAKLPSKMKEFEDRGMTFYSMLPIQRGSWRPAPVKQTRNHLSRFQ